MTRTTKNRPTGLHIYKDAAVEDEWRCELWFGGARLTTYTKTEAMGFVGQMVLALALGPGTNDKALSLLSNAAAELMNSQFFRAINSRVKKK